MRRGFVIGVCTVALVVFAAGNALACDTGSWLMLGGNPVPGDMTPLRGGGFDPGRLTLVWDRSGGEVVGTGQATADGRLETEVRIPADAAGRHKIIALDDDGSESAADPHAWTDVVVGDVVTEPAPMVAGPSNIRGQAPGLRATAVALGIIVVAITAVVMRRRRPVRSVAGTPVTDRFVDTPPPPREVEPACDIAEDASGDRVLVGR